MQQLSIQAVIFDFDGVIADTLPDIAAAVNAALNQFGYTSLSQEQILTFVGDGARRLLERALTAAQQASPESVKSSSGDSSPSASPRPEQESRIQDLSSGSRNRLYPQNLDSGSQAFDAFYDWYVEYYRTHCCKETRLYPGITGLLELLAIQEIPTAIVSNKPYAVTQEILTKIHLTDFFTAVIGPEQTSRTKPAPDGLLLALELINRQQYAKGKPPVKPQQVLMVGDSSTDIQAGKSAGTATCAVTGGYGNHEQLVSSHADFSIYLASELQVLFLNRQLSAGT